MTFENLTHALRLGPIQRMLGPKLRHWVLMISKITGASKDKKPIMVFDGVKRKPELTSTILV